MHDDDEHVFVRRQAQQPNAEQRAGRQIERSRDAGAPLLRLRASSLWSGASEPRSTDVKLSSPAGLDNLAEPNHPATGEIRSAVIHADRSAPRSWRARRLRPTIRATGCRNACDRPCSAHPAATGTTGVIARGDSPSGKERASSLSTGIRSVVVEAPSPQDTASASARSV